MTSYEQEARRRKAIAISNWCRQTGLSADDVIAMTDLTRAQACKDAGVNVASAQTWALVVGLLGALAATDRMPAAMRAALPDDPFDGIAPPRGETMAEHFANLESDTWPVRPGTDDEKHGPRARND